MPPGEGALAVGVLLHPHFTEDFFGFCHWSGVGKFARYVPSRDASIGYHH